MGSADATIALSPSTPLADAVVTVIGNIVKSTQDIPNVIEKAQSIQGSQGIVIIKDDKIGVWGKVKIVPLG